MTKDTQALASFRRVALITICAVYFLILVGASVRASGAGMGCPDWPTCFGTWIPPVNESQLPANYQEIYADRGYAETRFNPVKTWIEYLNRLLGVTIGLLILISAFKSWACLQHDRWITIASVAALFMVVYQGWLGSRVVASNLQPGMITVHMLMALAIVGVLLFAFARARRGVLIVTPVRKLDKGFQTLLYIVLGMTVVQVAMGTQVREMIDFLNHTQGEARSGWVSALPWFFYVHRTFSAVVLAANIWLVYMLWRAIGPQHSLTRLAAGMLVVVVLAIVSGSALNHLGMPAFVQPTHLLSASLLFGLQFLIWMDFRHTKVAV